MPKDYAIEFGPETPLEVYTPNNPPPPGGPFLKLDQNIPEHVINGSPRFDEGITIKAGKKIYLDG